MNQVLSFIRVIGIITLVFLGIFYLVDNLLIKTSTFYASQDFCEEYGYDTTSIRGTYLPYKDKDYGMIQCLSFYVDTLEYKKFNVNRGWTGRFALVGEGVA